MLQERTASKDELGGQPQVWQDIAPVRFGLESTGGAEVQTGGGARAQSTYLITMRYRVGVKSTMRIKQGERVFNFTHVDDIEERHRELNIAAIEGVSAN
jgi:SPP1 family predicted phage head-tail adaptor